MLNCQSSLYVFVLLFVFLTLLLSSVIFNGSYQQDDFQIVYPVMIMTQCSLWKEVPLATVLAKAFNENMASFFLASLSVFGLTMIT